MPELPSALVVDDDPVSLMLLSAWASGAGLTPATATDGLQAHRILLSGLKPAVIITDIEMPNLDGRALIKRVRENVALSTIPVIVVSSQPPEDEHDADHWFGKGESARVTSVLRAVAAAAG